MSEPTKPTEEQQLCGQRFALLTEARRIVAEILDHWAAIARLWQEFKLLKARDAALVAEIKTHRIGIINDADSFIPQMGMDTETRKTCEQIARRSAKLRERFQRLLPPRAVGRVSSYTHPYHRSATEKIEAAKYAAEMERRAKRRPGRIDPHSPAATDPYFRNLRRGLQPGQRLDPTAFEKLGRKDNSTDE